MIPKHHPRRISLKTREKIVDGMRKSIASMHGLIAHGRGEAFDYLIGEKTNKFAIKSIEAAAAMLLLAKHPVISVNGNAAALVPKELAFLSKIADASLEVNIFHSSKKRELRIKKHMIRNGAKNVLLPEKKYQIKFLASNRKYVNHEGIFKSDVVFVPLEDGDRAEALIKNGKKVITIDLNPLSRTAQKSTITIVDNIIRAMPFLIKKINICRRCNDTALNKIIKDYSNKKVLEDAMKHIKRSI